ncbi:MAG TPA: alpha-glucan family phosphorylase [Bacteroidota bacterium]|nr:alpha-glucan family phosphorylase [Bacteroidota bacterium]
MAPRRIAEKQIDATISLLQELAYNLWWSWNPSAQQIFQQLSPFFWEHSNHNPVEVMQWISGPELRGRLEDPEFFEYVSDVCKKFQAYMRPKKTWAMRHAPSLKNAPVAYFSAEFGLHESLRIYSGGLGILSGDHAKSASDLGLPFVGISLFYRQGYFNQQISADGWQQELYPVYDPHKLPLVLAKDKKGLPIICEVMIGTTRVAFRAWEVHVGRVKVYLLDTDLPQNDDRSREITAHVYGGDQTTRISQEIILGIGGVRLLRALGLTPSVFHMNEGHSAFLTLELLREQLDAGKPLDKAEAYVRQHCVFTTHTPVPAGHDRFPRDLMNYALHTFADSMRLSLDRLMEYGRIHPQDVNETFCMTVLALKMSRAANGVSQLHGKTSVEMWKELYRGWAQKEDPIGAITNGVHINGWASPTASQWWSRQLGERWYERINDAAFWKKAVDPKRLSDAELWALRTRLRRELVEFARKRLREQHLRHGGDGLGVYDSILLPDVLTIGFARRFATYKRAPLLFRDMEWAIRMLNSKERPIQIIFAGKAHPRDDAGKHFIQEIVNMTKRLDMFGKVVFIENYDINVARYLVSGCDVWLNTPRRPMEACGTSGQKVLLHGGLNVSTMDGWWREAYDGKNGWKVGEDQTYPTEHEQDDRDAQSLREVLEHDVIPLFYDRGKDGIPHNWLKRVRHSIATLIPQYNTDRMVIEYTQKYYLPKKK